MTIREKILAAYQRREALHSSDTEAYRLFHGYSEGVPGLEIDLYGEVAVISSKGADTECFAEAGQALSECRPFSCIVGKSRQSSPYAIVGTMPTEATWVREFGCEYNIEAFAPRNPGLYLDARPAREWIQQNSQGIRVLNLFSYAGSLGVAAMSGGALSVTHVDTQKRALKRCAHNHEKNQQLVDSRDLICQDVPKYLAKLAKSKRRFGGVIVDPPPYKPGSRSDMRNLNAVGLSLAAMAGLSEGGWMLSFFHHDPRTWDELEAAVSERCGRELEVLWRAKSGPDFPEEQESTALRLSVFR